MPGATDPIGREDGRFVGPPGGHALVVGPAEGRSLLVQMRRASLEVRVTVRRPTQRRRGLPDFLIIGTQRGGTTSLYRYLEAHPGVEPSLGKELQYFSTRWRRGVGWYRAHFPLVAHQAATARRLSFEATPYYLFHPHAAQRAGQLVGGARIIVLLRNPIDRAFSHFRHNVERGLEPLGFEQALAAEEARIGDISARLADNPDDDDRRHQLFSYVARGLYAAQLERWLHHFPAGHVLVLRSEDLYERPSSVYGTVQTFLGLQRHDLPSYPVHAGRPTASPIPRALRAELAGRFRPHNRRLSQLIGREMGWDD